MTDTLLNPHDKFFRETFSRLEVARDLVRYYLPDEVAALLDIDSLQISKDSFIDPQLYCVPNENDTFGVGVRNPLRTARK